jgi:biopolymer transport protein ExbD
MSHGAGGASEKPEEPNLTPMLDMVLQLVMFFMLVANFVMDEANVNVKLPVATTAVSLDKSVDDVIYLNINREGWLLPTDGDRQERKSPESIRQYLLGRYRNIVDSAESPEKGKEAAKKTVVIIRGHQDARMDPVMTIMETCRRVGFEKVQLRAKTKQGEG